MALQSNYSPSGLKGNVIPKGYNQGQLQQFTPQQMQLFSSMFGQVGGNSQLSKLAAGDEGTFNQLEEPALRQFGQLQQGLASKFSDRGLGGRQSSGFRNAANAQSRDFASELQSQRLGLMRQAQQDLFGMSQGLLSQRPYEQFLQQKPAKKKSFIESLMGALLPAAGAAAGSYAAGPAGYQMGQEKGTQVANAFTRTQPQPQFYGA